jgi:hypothetical protein
VSASPLRMATMVFEDVRSSLSTTRYNEKPLFGLQE